MGCAASSIFPDGNYSAFRLKFLRKNDGEVVWTGDHFKELGPNEDWYAECNWFAIEDGQIKANVGYFDKESNDWAVEARASAFHIKRADGQTFEDVKTDMFPTGTPTEWHFMDGMILSGVTNQVFEDDVGLIEGNYVGGSGEGFEILNSYNWSIEFVQCSDDGKWRGPNSKLGSDCQPRREHGESFTVVG